MPERLRVATDAWLAEDPFDNLDALRLRLSWIRMWSPAAQIADDLAQSAEEHTLNAQHATERPNEYVLTTGLFATVLFFAASTRNSTGWSTGGRSCRSH